MGELDYVFELLNRIKENVNSVAPDGTSDEWRKLSNPKLFIQNSARVAAKFFKLDFSRFLEYVLYHTDFMAMYELN